MRVFDSYYFNIVVLQSFKNRKKKAGLINGPVSMYPLCRLDHY